MFSFKQPRLQKAGILEKLSGVLLDKALELPQSNSQAYFITFCFIRRDDGVNKTGFVQVFSSRKEMDN